MPRNLCRVGFVLFILSCGNPEKEIKERPLVYEGMSGEELKNVLGLPARIDSLSPIYDGETMKKMPVEKWFYQKRTVILINDTVKNPNLN